jgi:CRISP-associated protein Cas1
MPSIHSYIFSMEEEARYATLADRAMASHDILVLNGQGCSLRVSNNALHVKQGKLLGVDRDPIIYYKGTVPIRTIVFMGKSGTISVEAFHWCKEQNISIVMLDGIGNVLYSLSPEGESNAKLRRAQYQADITGMGGYIARELVRLKTLGQIETLKTIPSHSTIEGHLMVLNGRRVTFPEKGGVVYGELIWESFDNDLLVLSGMKDVDAIRMLEGRIALKYWTYLTGIPIYWSRNDEKIVPPHWKVITERPSTLSGLSPRKAICPFHSALNYLYGVAEHLLLCSIRAAGLDPACGFLHYDNVYRDSLVYDLIEPHRAEIDAKVLQFFKTTELRRGDIIMLPKGQIMLNKELSRYLIVSCLPDAKKLGDTVSWLVKCLMK